VVVIINAVPSSLILVTLMMEVLRSSETSVLTRATGRTIPEEGILHYTIIAFGQYPSSCLLFKRNLEDCFVSLTSCKSDSVGPN
jgi:hypothetical protein